MYLWGVVGRAALSGSVLPASEGHAAEHLLQQWILERVDEAPARATNHVKSSPRSTDPRY